MTKEEHSLMRLGKMVADMIAEVRALPDEDTGYACRRITFPGGEVHLIICLDAELVRHMEMGAAKAYDVIEKTPKSQTN